MQHLFESSKCNTFFFSIRYFVAFTFSIFKELDLLEYFNNFIAKYWN